MMISCRCLVGLVVHFNSQTLGAAAHGVGILLQVGMHQHIYFSFANSTASDTYTRLVLPLVMNSILDVRDDAKSRSA